MINSFENDSFDNHFSLFGEKESFDLNLFDLEVKRKELLSTVHPDRFSGGSDGQQKLALKWTTRINEAYNILKDPVKRAIYLCKLKGKSLDIEKSKAFSIEFLEEQMEMREDLAKISQCDSFDHKLFDELESRASSMLSESVNIMSTLFFDNFYEDQKVLIQIEAQVNICLFAQKFIIECFEVKRNYF